MAEEEERTKVPNIIQWLRSVAAMELSSLDFIHRMAPCDD